MAKKEKTQKKENPILVGILLLAVSAFLIANSSEFVWMLLGVIELPLWIPGVLAGVGGIAYLVSGIKAKKAKKEAQQDKVQ